MLDQFRRQVGDNQCARVDGARRGEGRRRAGGITRSEEAAGFGYGFVEPRERGAGIVPHSRRLGLTGNRSEHFLGIRKGGPVVLRLQARIRELESAPNDGLRCRSDSAGIRRPHGSAPPDDIG